MNAPVWQSDLTNILATSSERLGARRRYAVLLAAAMRMVAAQPEGPLTQAGNELAAGPYVLYYRPIQPGLIEIVRVLHERTELS